MAWSAVRRWPKTALFFAGGVSVVLLACVQRQRTELEAIEVPKDLADLGFTSTVVSRRLLALVDELEWKASVAGRLSRLPSGQHPVLASLPTLGPRGKLPEIELLGTRVSLETVMLAIRKRLPRDDVRISGEITDSGRELRLTLRCSDLKSGPCVSETAAKADVDALLQRGAEKLTLVVDPCNLAIVRFDDESHAPYPDRYRRTREAIDRCQAKPHLSDDVRAHDLSALVLVQTGKNHAAIAKCKEALAINPKDANAFRLWGWAYSNLDQQGPAIEKYKQALAINPKDADAYVDWGWELSMLGRDPEAIEMYQRALAIDPKAPDALRLWGWSLSNLGQQGLAIEKYQEALVVNPKDAYAYVAWGGALLKLGRYDEVIEKCKNALDVDQNSADAYVAWGRALSYLGQQGPAIEKYVKAVDINRNDAYARVAWGGALSKLGRHGEAIEKYQEALRANPNSADAYADAHANWGWALSTLGRYDDAIKQFQQAVAVAPKSSSAYELWGLVLSRFGRDKEALEKYKQAVAINPNDVDAYYSWGWTVLKLSGDKPAIERYCQAARPDRTYAELCPESQAGSP